MHVTEFRLKLYPEDFDRVRAFYAEVLQFPVLDSWDEEERRGAMFDTGSGVIELLVTPSKDPQPPSGADVSLEVEDVQALWEELKDQTEVVFSIRDNDWGDTSFCIADPEGFELTFFTRSSADGSHVDA